MCIIAGYYVNILNKLFHRFNIKFLGKKIKIFFYVPNLFANIFQKNAFKPALIHHHRPTSFPVFIEYGSFSWIWKLKNFDRIVNWFYHFPNRRWLLQVCSISLLKTLRKRRSCSLRAISPFPTVFSTSLRIFCYFHSIQNFRLQSLSVWKNLKFVVWESVNQPTDVNVLKLLTDT